MFWPMTQHLLVGSFWRARLTHNDTGNIIHNITSGWANGDCGSELQMINLMRNVTGKLQWNIPNLQIR